MNKGQLVTRDIKHLAESTNLKGSTLKKLSNGLIGNRFEMRNDFIPQAVVLHAKKSSCK